MHTRHSIVWLLVTVLGILAATSAPSAGGSLSVRLLEADNSDKPSSSAISDVMPVLKRTLRFSSYRLLTTRQMDRRNGATAKLSQGMTVEFSEVGAQSLTVDVRRDQRRILHTKLLLFPDKPLVVGGIPGKDGATLILVFMLL